MTAAVASLLETIDDMYWEAVELKRAMGKIADERNALLRQLADARAEIAAFPQYLLCGYWSSYQDGSSGVHNDPSNSAVFSEQLFRKVEPE